MYYDVLVASQRYHKSDALTYAGEEELPLGTVVEITLQNQSALGIIVGKAKKPNFKVKPIESVVCPAAITGQQLALLEWLKVYYPAPGGLVHSLFIPSYLRGQVIKDIDTPIKRTVSKQPALKPEQVEAIKVIGSAPGHSVLLHGVTGSGKTRVYTELTRKVLKGGRSAIILTPEIGLTPQLLKSFTDLFPQVIAIHSAMTPKQRRVAWFNIATSQQPIVVIGPRSALFTPVQSIGLIVVDEMHDPAYKQEQAPYYLTPRVAAKLADLSGAKAILASATPPVADYYAFEHNNLPIIRMKDKAIGNKRLFKANIVDLREREQFTKSGWISNVLIQALSKALEGGQQSLLFLNRRGTARIILCQICGWQAVCPRCDLPLTYHGDTHRAICHTCGHSEPTPPACRNCGSTEIIFKSAGTKSVVSELERLFPKARVQRFDSDLKKTDRLQSHYHSIIGGNVDILVGTQMLGKGLDLPNLSVVGVILADTSLNFPDFTAEERTFQMLNQVIGRVDRGHRDSEVIIQTYNPLSPVIKQAIAKDYKGFYNDQLKERRQYNFPPFCYLLKLTCSRRSQSSAKNASLELSELLAKLQLPIEVIGPSPAFTEKTSGNYHWQLVVKASKRSNLLRIISLLPANWQYDLDPVHLL